MKNFLAVLLAAAVLSAGCLTPAAAKETAFFSTFPQDVPASTLVRTSANDTAFAAAAAALEAALQAQTATDEEIAALLKTLATEFMNLRTAFTACMLDYYRDSAAAGTDYSAWSSLIARDTSRYVSLLQTALKSNYAETVRAIVGDAALNMNVDNQTQLEVLSRCDALVSQYWTGERAGYTASIGGGSYTYEALVEAYNSKKISYDQYIDGSVQIAKQKNAAVAPIFTSLVQLRTQYAVSKGYKNYADYAYPNVFGRDFTTQDAQRFESYVKKYIVPVSRRFGEIASVNGELGTDRLGGLYGLDQQQTLALVQPHMNDVSSEYAKLFDYMVRNGLCDLQPSAAKLDVSFTTDLPQYHSAYIFSSPGGTLEDVSTLIHEFGHFAQACLDEGGVRCYDVAEIDSQGLEALYLKYADSIAGEAGGDAFRCDTASRLLRLVIQGCLFDEFQQKVYENGNMSVTEMNRLYRSLGEEYGMNFVSTGDEAYGWVDVNHNYEQPFYYLSYATSAAASLELLTLSMDDPNGADNKYLQLVADSDDDSYCALMRRSGLPSVFEEKNVQALADRTLRYMEREVADVPDYTDISGHWFESGAKLISAEGLMRGSGTSFDPDGKLTRAMFAAVLYRTFGGKAGSAAVFGDVDDPSTWYYDAVNWAAARGYVKGSGGQFLPGAPITRQDMAVILARAAGAGETAPDDDALGVYADSAAIAPYARGAVAYVTQAGLMQGSAGSFAPVGETTRAEVGQVFIRLVDNAA